MGVLITVYQSGTVAVIDTELQQLHQPPGHDHGGGGVDLATYVTVAGIGLRTLDRLPFTFSLSSPLFEYRNLSDLFG